MCFSLSAPRGTEGTGSRVVLASVPAEIKHERTHFLSPKWTPDTPIQTCDTSPPQDKDVLMLLFYKNLSPSNVWEHLLLKIKNNNNNNNTARLKEP